jgi:hypothetical protein
LNTNRDHEELYHEEYDTVAVMFASLTEYALWDDNGDGANELSSIRLLNQIICDFDKVNNGHEISFILKRCSSINTNHPLHVLIGMHYLHIANLTFLIG